MTNFEYGGRGVNRTALRKGSRLWRGDPRLPALALCACVAVHAPAAADDPETADAMIAQAATVDDETAGQAAILPDTVVTASRVPLPAREVGSAVTVITAEDLENKQVRILSDVLREVPGVAVSRSGTVGTATQVRIRGAEGNHTLVIIDGIEMNDPSSSAEYDFGNMLATDIDRIEVIRGPQSALYGSDAVGGVINIITKKGRGPITASLALEGGSFRTGQAKASVRGGGGWYDFSLGASGFKTGGVSIARESLGNAENDGYRNWTYDANLGIRPIEDLDIRLTGRFVRSIVQTDPQPGVAGVIPTIDGDNETEEQQRFGRVRVRYGLFDDAWEHILAAGINEQESNTLTNGAVTSTGDGERAKFEYQTNLFFDTPAVADASHTLTFLAEREDEAQITTNNFGGFTDLDITNYGYVGEYRVGLWDRLFLSGSVRFDDNDIFEDATTFRTTAAYVHEETGTRLHGSYGTGVKNPDLFELFGFAPPFVGNPDLTPEKSRGWDVGVEQTLLDERLTVDATYFNHRITDLIQGFGNTAVNVGGTSRIWGFEISGRAEVLDGLTVNGEYTFTHGLDANNVQLVRRARHLASLNANYAFLDDRANVNVGVDYNGAQRDLEFSAFYANSQNITLASYVLVTLAASYEVFDGIEIYGRVENALDQDYEEVLFYSTPGIGGFIGVRATVELF